MPAAAFTTNRLLLYGAVSTALASFAVYTTFSTHSNYYSAIVHLSKSNGSILTLANFLVFVALLVARIMQFIFFGALRATEVERLYDRTWYFLTESLLAFTIFREDFDAAFVCLFGGLLFVKSFHWLLADRVEAMDQQPYPGPPKSFHIRTIALFNLLALVDVVMIASMAEIILHEGVDGLVLFLSEYAILLASLLNCWLKYLISVYDIYRASRRGGDEAPPWEHKSMYIFYVELLTDFLKLSTYLSFFLTVLTYYGLPLNIVRDVFLTARSFVGRVRDLLRYRAATRDMDHRYPDAQTAEMEALGDRTCIICRDEMVSRAGGGGGAVAGGPNTTPKKLPCGHIFHFHCLRSWLERQQSCPTCRRTVLESGRPTLANNANGNANANANPGAPNPAGPAAQNQQGAIAIFNRAWNGLGQAPPPAAPAPPQPAQGPAPPPLYAQPPTAFPWAANAGQVNPPPWMQAPPQPRQFQGFNAGGQWHPWGAPPPETEREQRQRVDSNAAGGLVIPGQPGLVTSPAPIERDTTPIQLNHPITGPTGPPPPAPTPVRQIIPVPNKTPPEAKEGASATGSGLAPGGSGNGPLGSTPREAAALAALRRFQAGRSTESLKPPAPAPAAGASPALTPGTPTPTPTVPDARSSKSPPASGPGSGSSMGSILSSRSTAQAPALIPLYNPGAASSAGGPSMSTPSPYFADASSASTPLIDLRPHASSLPRSPPPPFGQSSGSSAYFAPSQLVAQAQPQGGLPRPGQLPPNLTDAQLGQLDRLTREAIDERLRVLEGVQSTVWRCVEDLTRMRSALPETATATGPGPLRLGGGARTGSSMGANGSRETSIGSSIGSSFGVEVQRELREANGGEIVREGEADVKGKGKDVSESSGEEYVVENGDAS